MCIYRPGRLETVTEQQSPDPDAMMGRARETLRAAFGYDDFLPGQAAPLAAILAEPATLAPGAPTGKPA